MDERHQLEQAIAVQESLRGTIDDAIIDATITALKQQLGVITTSPIQQRKLATVLFTDIVGSTRLTQGMDPEEQMALIDPLVQRLAARVNEHGGHVCRYQGDGFKAVFGLPVAQENDPVQAIRASLAIQDEAALIAEGLETQRGLSGFQVRVGLTTGLVFSGGETEGEDTIKGEPVNLAARLESAAQPGTVLISHDAYKHVRGVFDVEPLKPIELKGFSELVAVYQVLREKERPFYRGMRGVEGVETKMVGRDLEFQQLQKMLEDTLEDRVGQMITVVGSAGVGKSRLLYEFENWADLLPEEIWLYKGRSRLETQGLPYALLRDLFTFRFDIQDDDSAQVVRDKLESGFGEVFGEGEESEKKAHIIGQLLGYAFEDSPHLKSVLENPQQLRNQAVMYLVSYFKTIAQRNPILILMEDLHWADEASLDVLNTLAVDLEDQPVIMLGTARHGLLERRPHWGEGQDFHRRIVLEPLSNRESRKLVAEVLQRVQDVPEALSKLVVNNAEGNPFYVEELIKMLVEDGVIIREEPHWRVEISRLEEVHVPSTLTGVLQARLDGLTEEERKALQGASVVGRVFWDKILEYINGSLPNRITDGQVTEVLEELRSRELIFRRETSAFADAHEHIFKHALLREVTYESVLKRVRQTHHALVAEWLIEHAGDREGEFTGLIADHLEFAGSDAQARQYLLRAGKQAVEKYANQEAASYFSRALNLTAESDFEGQFEILLDRVQIYNLIGSREAQETDINTLEILAEVMEDRGKQAQALLQRANFVEVTADFALNLEVAKSAVSFAREAGDEELEAAGHLAWGRMLYYQDEIEKSLEHGKKGLELARKFSAYELIIDALRLLGNIASEQHDYELSLQYVQESLAISRKLGDRIRECKDLNNIGVFYLRQFKIDQALSYYQTGLTLSRETGDILMEGHLLANLAPMYMIIGMYPKAQFTCEQVLAISRKIKYTRRIGDALTTLGVISCFIENDYHKAITYFNEGLSLSKNLNDPLDESGFLWGLAFSQIGLKNWTEAERLIKESMEVLQKTTKQHYIKFLQGNLAEIYLAKGIPEQAVEQIDLILKDWETSEINAFLIDDEIRLLCICYQVLLACDDLRARKVIATAYSVLQEFAAKIESEELRKSFLNNVPWNRGIIEMWEAEQKKKQGDQS